MRYASVLLVVCCLSSAVKAQWAERTIPVPDSLNHTGGIRFVVFNPANQTVYAGGYFGMSVGASVVAIDAASPHKVADVPLTGHVAGLCVNPTNNKVYCALENRSFVSVIDAALNRVVYDIPSGHEVTSMCYNPTPNKVYCARSQGTTSGVLVVDGATDSVLGVVDTAWSMALCCNPVRNRVYGACYYRDRVVVIDGQTNEVVRRIPVRHMPTDVCYNSVRDKVYCAHEGDSCLVVIDCRTDSVVATIKVSRTRNSLCYNPQNDRVYCIDYYRKAVTVIDGAGDSVLANVPVGYSPWVLCYNAADNCVYCNDNASGDTVFVIDGATNAVVACIPGRGGTFAFCSDSARNQMFTAADYLNEVRVIDGATHRVGHIIQCRTTPYSIACDTVGRKFYCVCGASPGIGVLDGTTNTVLTTLLPDGSGSEIVCNSRLRKAYVPNRSGGMIVLDTHADTILRVIPGAAAWGLCLDEDAGVLYGIRDTLSVLAIDCTGDSVLAVAGTQARPQAVLACPGIDKVFVVETDWYQGTAMVEVFDKYLGYITTIPTDVSSSFALAYNPVQRKVYMSVDHDLLLIIDAMSDSVVSVLPMADDMVSFCYNTRDNKVYCDASNVPTSPIAVIDGAADTVLAWVQAGQLLGEMLYEPYRNKVYCVNSQSNDVTVLDGAGDSVLTNITGFGKPRALAHLPAWNRIYVANYDSSSITVIRDSSPVGCEEAASVAVRRGPRDRPTIVRGILTLPEALSGERPAVCAHLHDISGRRVLSLHPGANDVRHLAPGVYFVREASGAKRAASSVRKVVLTE